MSDTLDVIASIETAYADRLAERATLWQTRHPELAKRLREDIDRHFGKEPEPGSLVWQAREAAIVEAIRQKKGWPTMREYVRLQGGEEPSPPRYLLPVLKKGPVRDLADGKAASAGDT